MDLNLAGVDGRDITRELRQDSRTENIPIVVMTGLMLDQSSYKPLFDDFLAKPFHLHELQHLVDKYIQVEKSNMTKTKETGSAPPRPDPEQIRSFWSEELDTLYAEAEMSGSLDTAAEFGQKIYEHGTRENSAELAELGEKLKRFALDLDIQGVDHVLKIFREITGKNE